MLHSALQNLAEFDGASAVIHEIRIPPSDLERLKSLGVFAGQSIEVRRAASAVIIIAAGGRLAVSSDIAREIIVHRTPTANVPHGTP